MSTTKSQKEGSTSVRVPCLLGLFLLVTASNALADEPARVRALLSADDNGADSMLIVSKRKGHISLLGRPQIEISGGLIKSKNGDRGILSVGPVWQWRHDTGIGAFVSEFSIAPTILTAGKLHRRDLGGVFHFTSGAALGWQGSRDSRFYFGLRIQHTSNASTHRNNPGLNAFGIEFQVRM